MPSERHRGALGGHLCFTPYTNISSVFHSQYTSYSPGHFIFTCLSLVSHLVCNMLNDRCSKDWCVPSGKLLQCFYHLPLDFRGFLFLVPFYVPQVPSWSPWIQSLFIVNNKFGVHIYVWNERLASVLWTLRLCAVIAPTCYSSFRLCW